MTKPIGVQTDCVTRTPIKKFTSRKVVDNMGGLIIIGVLWIIIDLIKAACEPTIPAENWKNVGWDVFDKDTKTTHVERTTNS